MKRPILSVLLGDLCGSTQAAKIPSVILVIPDDVGYGDY
jgi:hypothetical protein